MSPAAADGGMKLSKKELRMMVQSLSNCIDTCKNHGKRAACEDCDAARKLQRKLERRLEA
jgi:hypothetical protein